MIMTQEVIEEYGDRIVREVSVEAHAMLTVGTLIGIKLVKEGTITTPEESIIGGIILLSGNSLVAAHYREISGNDFKRSSYLLFPTTVGMLKSSVQSLAGKNTVVNFPPFDPLKLYAYIFYGNGFTIKEIPFYNSVEKISEMASLVAKKIHMLPASKELEELLDTYKKGN